MMGGVGLSDTKFGATPLQSLVYDGNANFKIWFLSLGLRRYEAVVKPGLEDWLGTKEKIFADQTPKN